MDNNKIIPEGGSLITGPRVGQALEKNLPDLSEAASVHQAEQAFDAGFRPRGAIAFFALLIILGMIIWFGIYFLMLSRI